LRNLYYTEPLIESNGDIMNQKIAGILIMVLAILLVVIYATQPMFLVYTYWIAVIILFIYGLYSYLRAE